MARVAEHVGSERAEELGSLDADMARAHDADGLAVDLSADEASGGAAVARGRVAFRHAAEHVDGQADGQLGDRDVGVAGAVADGYVALAAGIEPHVIDAGEGDGDHLEVVRALDNACGVGIVGDHDHIGVGGAARKLVGIGRLGVVVRKRVARLLQRTGQLGDAIGGNAERFKQCDLHG